MKTFSRPFIIIILFLITLLTIFRSYKSYTVFQENNLPVFDGVMNEFDQIRRFEKFNDDFSFIERYNQAVYEYKGNILSPAFSAFITAVFPSMLVNDWDIILRA